MNRTKSFITSPLGVFAVVLILIMGLSMSATAQNENPDDFNLVKLGDVVPNFDIKTIDGNRFNIEDYRGKTVLLNFFATWCPPCVKELPELEKQIWLEFKDKDFTVLVIGRGHNKKEVKQYRNKKNYSFPMAPDKDKAIYEKFFTKYIPRNVVINKEGKIIYLEHGYTEEEFGKLIKLIEEELY